MPKPSGGRGKLPADTPRALRPIRIGLRTAHLLAFACLYGGCVYAAPGTDLRGAVAATLGTGFALLGLDLVRQPITLVQVRGLASLIKLGLLLGTAIPGPPALLPLTVAAVIGAVSSHMPGRYRYFSLLHGRVVGSEERG